MTCMILAGWTRPYLVRLACKCGKTRVAVMLVLIYCHRLMLACGAGDKPRNFAGSKQWIGAIELGYILDELLGVTGRVITVPAGSELPSRAREIAQHFDSVGSPIMIGGGVLAYTLMGLDWCERTGECAFLILDPHFTGRDELKGIHSGQWIAWKRIDGQAAAGGKLFHDSAFYNLLCPQRMDGV